MTTLNTTFPTTPVRVHVGTADHAGFHIDVYRLPSGRHTTSRRRGVEAAVELGVNLLSETAALDATKDMIDLDAGKRQAFEGVIERRNAEDEQGERMSGDRWEGQQ